MIHFYAADAEIIATLQCTLRLPRSTKGPPSSSFASQTSGTDGWDQQAANVMDRIDRRRRPTDR